MTNELPSNVTEEQRRTIQAFVHSAITPLIEEVIVKKLGQAAIVLRDELSDENARAAVEQAGGGGNVGPEPPSGMVWPPDGAVWLAPIETDHPANPKLLQYAWARSNLSSGQMAEAYQCIVSAAQDCGQEYRLPLAAPPTASAGVTEAMVEVVPVVVSDAPDAHRVQFVVGTQQFHIGPDYFDTKAETEFFAGMFRQALAQGGGNGR
jgi:hypothetical protein